MKSTEQSGRDAGQTTSDWFIRTGASQVPSPPSRLALRPPPRSGFVQGVLCHVPRHRAGLAPSPPTLTPLMLLTLRRSQRVGDREQRLTVAPPSRAPSP